jgi:spore germination protein YaaH
MAIFKSIPSKRIINGNVIETSDSVIVTNSTYITNGEFAIVTKGVENCEIILNDETTDHVVIKSLTNTIVKSNKLIDEEFNEVELNRGSCVEFKKIGDHWYVLSSDGLKNS